MTNWQIIESCGDCRRRRPGWVLQLTLSAGYPVITLAAQNHDSLPDILMEDQQQAPSFNSIMPSLKLPVSVRRVRQEEVHVSGRSFLRSAADWWLALELVLTSRARLSEVNGRSPSTQTTIYEKTVKAQVSWWMFAMMQLSPRLGYEIET